MNLETNRGRIEGCFRYFCADFFSNALLCFPLTLHIRCIRSKQFSHTRQPPWLCVCARVFFLFVDDEALAIERSKNEKLWMMWGAYREHVGLAVCAIKYVSDNMGGSLFWLNGLREAMVTSVGGGAAAHGKGWHTHTEWNTESWLCYKA